jgi:hypothetical protein
MSTVTPCAHQHSTYVERMECVTERHRMRQPAVDAALRQFLADRAATESHQVPIPDLPREPEALPPDWQESFVETLAESSEFRTTVRRWLEVT